MIIEPYKSIVYVILIGFSITFFQFIKINKVVPHQLLLNELKKICNLSIVPELDET